jgi:hypothetical protein
MVREYCYTNWGEHLTQMEQVGKVGAGFTLIGCSRLKIDKPARQRVSSNTQSAYLVNIE